MNYFAFVDQGVVQDLFGEGLRPDYAQPIPEDVALLCIADGRFGIRTISGDLQPPPIITPVPEEVSYFQGCAALMQAGYLDEVEAYMAAPDTDPFEKLAWRSITVIRRNSEITVRVGALLGLSESQIDDLFRFAKTITA